MTEYALEYFDPDYITMQNPGGNIRLQVMPLSNAIKAVEYEIPQGKRDYRVVQREVTEWKVMPNV